MQSGARTSTTNAARSRPGGTHVSKPPRSNRQNLARLEIVATHTKQSPDAISNRQFFRLSPPLPWIQLQHEAFQLQQPGHFYEANSASTSEESAIDVSAPEGRQRLGRSARAGGGNKKESPSAGGAADRAGAAAASSIIPASFLITQSAIRNRRNPNKTNNRGHF
jgi:hypothetical protein